MVQPVERCILGAVCMRDESCRDLADGPVVQVRRGRVGRDWFLWREGVVFTERGDERGRGCQEDHNVIVSLL